MAFKRGLPFFRTVFQGLLDFVANGFIYLGQFWDILYDKPNGKLGQHPSIGRLIVVVVFVASIFKWISLEGGFLSIMTIALVYILAGKTVVPLSHGAGIKAIGTRVMCAIEAALGKKPESEEECLSEETED
jgi:hypothetical protein